MAAEEYTRSKAMSKLMKFFGRQPQQSLQEFAAETKALTDDDVRKLHDGIVDGSLTY